MIIYLIRHGRTISNATGLLKYDSYDLPLSPEGIIESNNFKKKISHIEPDIIITSGFCRTKQTARILFPNNANKILNLKFFNEINKGYEKFSYRKDYNSMRTVEWEDKNFKKDSFSEKNDIIYPSRVSLKKYIDKSQAELLKIINKNKKANNIVIIGHNGTIKSILLLACGKGLDAFFKFEVSPYKLYTILFDGKNFKK